MNIVGTVAAPGSFSDIKFEEIVQPAPIVDNSVMQIYIPKLLQKRKLYVWFFGVASNSADAYITGRLRLWLDGSQVGELPVFSAAPIPAGSLPKSLVSPFVSVGLSSSTGYPVQDTMYVALANPLTSEPSAGIMQATYLNGQADKITASVEKLRNVTAYRLIVACISSEK